MNIVDQILFQGRYHPPAAAICAPGRGVGLVSYGRLELYINNISAKVLALGIKRGDVVAVVVGDPILHAAIVLSLMHLGAVSVSPPGGIVPPGLNVRTVIADETPTVAETARVALVDLSWIEGDGKPVDKKWLASDLDQEICRIVLIYSPKRVPKAVAITHRMLVGRTQRNGFLLGNRFPACSRIFSDLGLETSLGFQILIQTLLRGGMAFFGGSSFEDTLEAFENYNAECWVTTPMGLSHFLRFYEEIPQYPSHLQAVISVGDVLPKPLAAGTCQRICSHLISSYGSTEMSLTAVAPFHAIADIPDAVGYVAPGSEVQVVDEAGTVLTAGKQGSIRIRSHCGVDRYLNSADETSKAFRDGWFYPGDTGGLTKDGVLVVTSRATAT